MRRMAYAALLTLAACAAHPGRQSSGPPIYVVERGKAKVYIFGGAAPSDRRWLTPTIESAFRESSELWKENPSTPPDSSRNSSSEQLRKRTSGSLFDDPSEKDAARLMRVANSLDIKREELEPY